MYIYIYLEPTWPIFWKSWPIKWNVNPQKKVSWVLGIYIFVYIYIHSLPRSHDLVLLPWPLAVFYPRTWNHRKRLWKQPSTSNHQATPDAPCMEYVLYPHVLSIYGNSCRYKIFHTWSNIWEPLQHYSTAKEPQPKKKNTPVFTTQIWPPWPSFTTGETVGVCAVCLRPSVGPVRATSLERLLDQHKVCRTSLLVG